MLAVSYGSFVLGFGIGLTQAIVATVVGAVAQLPARRPGLDRRQARLGADAGAQPGAVRPGRQRAAGLVSYLLLVGWETVLVSLATLATATVFDRLGWSSGDSTKVVAFVVVAGVIVAAGVLGFDAIMKIQKWLTIAMIVVTGVYVAPHLRRHRPRRRAGAARRPDLGGDRRDRAGDDRASASAGSTRRPTTRGTCRAPPARTGVVFWPTFGGSAAGGRPGRRTASCSAPTTRTCPRAIAADPIGALTTLLPTWFLVPFALVAVGGLVSGAILDIYSSGLTLLALGLQGAALDGGRSTAC